MPTLSSINSSYELEPGDILATPDPEAAARSVSHPASMARLDAIESPGQRVLGLYKSILSTWTQPTHEAGWVRHLTLAGLFFGTCFGALANSSDLHERYVRRHNASVFNNQHASKRHFFDEMILGLTTRGLKRGLGCGLIMGSTGLVFTTSLVYRNELYLPDYLLGFTGLGAISRSSLGARGALFGAGAGAAFGLLTYGLGRTLELLTGMSAAQLRYLNHQTYVANAEATRIKRQEAQMEAVEGYLKGDW